MTRLIASGDQHIGATFTTLAEQRSALARVIDAALQADVLLLLGDATDRPRPAPAVLEVWGEQLARLEGTGVRVVAISGNETHDGPDVLRVLSRFRGDVTVHIEPGMTRIGDVVDVAALPWIPDHFVRAREGGRLTKEETAAALTRYAREMLGGLRAQRRPGVPLVLITHATIAGAETSTGFSFGSIPVTSYLLPVEEIEGFDFVFAGHIHRHHQVAANAAYSGSLLPKDFSETEPKGYLSAEIGARGITEWEFVAVPTPSIWTLDYDAAGLREANGKPLTFTADLVRVRAHVDEETAREIPPARAAAPFYAAGARLVQVEYDIARQARVRDDAMTADLGPAAALARYLAGREDLDEDQRTAIAAHADSIEVEQAVADDARPGGSDLELVGIECADFLGIGSAELALGGGGVVALTGPVGAGKSSLGADAIRHALFGVTRYGAKTTERVVRQGGEVAETAVTLRAADGHEWRVVRRVKAGARGAAATLDVLERNGQPAWRPVGTSAKIAAGQEAVDRLLGGLSDDALCASSIVVQRDADRFAAARPEARKALLAQAAGLAVYDDLAERTRQRLRAAEAELAALDGKASVLRVRVAGLPALEADRTAAAAARASATADADAAESRRDEQAAVLERERARAIEYARVERDIAALREEQAALERGLADWDAKRDAANRILGERLQLEAARAELAKVRARIADLEAAQERHVEQLQNVRRAEQQRTALERELTEKVEARRRAAAIVSAELESLRAEHDAFAASPCGSACQHVLACTTRSRAAGVVRWIADGEARLTAVSETTADEISLAERIRQLDVGTGPDIAGNALELRGERAKAQALEQAAAVAEKLAKAEQILEEHASATAALGEQLAVKRQRVGNLNQLLVGFATNPAAAVTRLEGDLLLLAREAQRARAAQQRAAERVAGLDAGIAVLRQDAAELEALESKVRAGAADAAALSELATAWKACRVMVMESSVLPSVEAIANEVLAKFPYGLQLAFSTQRETRAREQSETLEIGILGERASVYEGLSGGQRTAVDVALHVAIALVVSRRSSARIRLLFADEPEGLDEPGRAAFAEIARWVAQEFGLLVLVASHSPDLIEALGGRRIEIVPSPDGSTAVAA